jgi:hypothetical protein
MRVFFLILIFLVFNASATIWKVGSTRSYTLPSQVSTLVQNGDTVEIDSGVYASDVAYWAANNLLLEGVNGFAQLASGGLTYGDKAIWVIGGSNTTVEYVEFSQATSTSNNGAGIRQEGSNLTVRHSYFHNNQDGILAGTVNPSNIVIEYSEFGYNGYGDGYTHNLYINNIDTLIFQYNYSHDANVGHELKSRAHVNYILYNRISDETTGTASRSIDLPNGGAAYIIGNEIEQGPMSQNSNIVGYGLEGLTNPAPHNVYAINNSIVNDKSNGSFFQFQPATNFFKGYNNIIAGPGSFITGTMPDTVDTAANFITGNINSAGFVNAANYDYQIANSSSPVINAGINPGSAGVFPLSPVMIYIHPDSATARCVVGNLDIGAYEFCGATMVEDISKSVAPTIFYPVPTHENIYFSKAQKFVSISNVMGQLLYEFKSNGVGSDLTSLNVGTLPDGIYFVETTDGTAKLIKD